MPYSFHPAKMYRMPTHFGPSLGPRQGQEGCKFSCVDNPRMTTISVSFLTRRESLEALLPDGFQLEGEPIVTVAISYITEIEWLAGRGYNTLSVSFPACFNGKQDRAIGNFLPVFWENLTDPILAGREELGFSKIYCDLPEPRVCRGETHCAASWMGFKFMDLRTNHMKQLPLPIAQENRPGDDGILRGTLHYKYIPKTGEWGSYDIAYAVLTPEYAPNHIVKEIWRGEGIVQFHRATWEDLPTQYTIVNAFACMEIKAYQGATLLRTIGGKDVSDQRTLR